jgi:pimeloyl-ACP methyl ester carboxylesterase
VPRSAGERYVALLWKASFETVGAAGHCVEMEQPAELARLVSGFIEGS